MRQVMMMKVYALSVNDEQVLDIEVDAPGWLPVRPVLNRQWLRSVVAQSLRRAMPVSNGCCERGGVLLSSPRS